MLPLTPLQSWALVIGLVALVLMVGWLVRELALQALEAAERRAERPEALDAERAWADDPNRPYDWAVDGI